jgi:hypothetical protein
MSENTVDVMWLLLSMAAFAASVLIHAVALRLFERTGAVTAFVVIGGAIGALLFGYCGLRYEFAPTTITAVLTYAFVCELYIFLFTFVGNSVSFALMAKLDGCPLKPAEIAGFYRTEAMVERRFEQLELAKLIVRGQAGWRLTARGKRIVQVFSFLRSAFCRPYPGGVTSGLRGR